MLQLESNRCDFDTQDTPRTMPIDLRRCDHADSKDRYLQGHVDKPWLDELLHTALAQRATVIQRRTALERYKASLRATNETATNRPSKESSRAVIHDMQKEVTVAEAALDEIVWRLPNWTDTKGNRNESTDANDAPASNVSYAPHAESSESIKISAAPNDPLFGARCYEEIDVSSGATATVLMRSGHDLWTALHEYFVVYMDQTEWICPNNSIVSWSHLTQYHVPASMESVPSLDHSIQSLTRPTEQPIVCDTGSDQSVPPQHSVPLPSWMTLLRQQLGTYWDRQLPRLHIVSCTTAGPSPVDVREGARRTTWSKSHAWYERLCLSTQIQCLIVTGPSLEADSRPLQHDVMQYICGLYKALLDGTTSSPQFSIRATPVAELSSMEASRLELVGTMPSTARRVCLAYVSNTLDYCSTGPTGALRHGTTKEGLHVVHGVVCSLAETMEWLGQNRADAHGIGLPSGLQQSLPERFVYTRKLVINPNGKRHVQEIVPPVATTEPRPSTAKVPLVSTLEDPSALPQDRDMVASTNDRGPTLPSQERIRAESMSSPFPFLPFYYR